MASKRRNVHMVRSITIGKSDNRLIVAETQDRKRLRVSIVGECVFLDSEQLEQLLYSMRYELELDNVKAEQPATDGEPELTTTTADASTGETAVDSTAS